MTNLIKQNTKILVMHKVTNYALTALIFAAALFYMYFANTTVHTLTVLQKTKVQMQTLSVEVSEMESRRLSIENNINAARALSLGFVEVNNPIFIMKNAQKTSLSLKTD
jgi:hypothetical protein